MSNLWLNIRFWMWHLQAGDRKWYQFSIHKNDYHKYNWRIFAVYDLEWPKSSNHYTASGEK